MWIGISKRLGKSGLRVGVAKRLGGGSKAKGGSSTDFMVGLTVIGLVIWWFLR